MEKIPFWEETYRNNDINTFPAEPNGTILEFEHLLKKDSVMLEAGCGEGQNVRYLANNGYSYIDAFDLSEAGISKLKCFCEREGLRINAFVDDLRVKDYLSGDTTALGSGSAYITFCDNGLFDELR